MRAAVFYEPGQPLKIEDVSQPTVAPDGALVKVAACGVCHTDLHYLDGVPTFKKPPLILGHEASGLVAEVGQNVTHLKGGDRVLIPPVVSCGKCHCCRTGRENICQNLIMIGNSVDGAYAEYAHVPAKDLIPLPSEVPIDEAAVISDALSTPFHAIKNRGRVKPGDTVAIFGCGGLGLNAVQVATTFGASVIAVDVIEGKLHLARELGATETIDAKTEDPVKAIRRIVKAGVDVAFEAIGSPDVMRQAYESVRWGGRTVIMGYSPKDVSLNAGRMMFREIEVLGSLGCRVVDYPSIVELVRRGRLKLLVSERRRLDEINDVFEMLRAGRILTRAIVTP